MDAQINDVHAEEHIVAVYILVFRALHSMNLIKCFLYAFLYVILCV